MKKDIKKLTKNHRELDPIEVSIALAQDKTNQVLVKRIVDKFEEVEDLALRYEDIDTRMRELEEREEARVSKSFKILCPYCDAAYTADMEEQLEISTCCYDTCESVDAKITIKCANCKRIVYKK